MILKDSQDFVYNFSMALYFKWDVKNGFTFVLQFFGLVKGVTQPKALYDNVIKDHSLLFFYFSKLSFSNNTDTFK